MQTLSGTLYWVCVTGGIVAWLKVVYSARSQLEDCTRVDHLDNFVLRKSYKGC